MSVGGILGKEVVGRRLGRRVEIRLCCIFWVSFRIFEFILRVVGRNLWICSRGVLRVNLYF